MTNTITSLPRTATFQFRINPKVRERVEAAKREQAVNRLMSEIAIGEATAEDDNWISESDILSEFKSRP